MPEMAESETGTGKDAPENYTAFNVPIEQLLAIFKSIYAKLDSHSREEAVERARALNLL